MRNSPGFSRLRLGMRLTPVVTWLIGINLATFLLFTFSGPGVQAVLARWLRLTPRSLLQGHVWKLVSTIFFPTDALGFLFDLLVLWMFVPVLESAWGRRRFIGFFALTSIVGNLVAAGVGLALGREAPIAGITSFIYAAIAGYGVAFANQPISFFGVIPMKGKTLAIGMAVVVTLAVVLNGTWVEGAGYAGAMVTAVIWTAGGRLSPRVWMLRWRRARLRRRYTVLDGGSRPEKKWLN